MKRATSRRDALLLKTEQEIMRVLSAEPGILPNRLLDLLNGIDLSRGEARNVMQEMIEEGTLQVDSERRLSVDR